MKIFVVLLVLYVAEMQCGLVSNLMGKPDNKEPDLLNKVLEGLENGTAKVVDALGNIIVHGSKDKGKQPTEDKKLRNGLPTVVDDVCVIDDDPNKCV